MAYTAPNMAMGPADIYVGTFGATEPTQANVNTAPASSAFTHVGLTLGGVKLSVKHEFSELEADQIVDRAGSVMTKRDVTLEVGLAEVTLANLILALNGGTTVTGVEADVYTPTDSSDTTPDYKAIIVDGKVGTGATTTRRRFIVRKVLSTEGIEISMKKDDQQVFEVTFLGHYVDGAIAPYVIHNGNIAI